MDFNDCKNILIIRPDNMGDLLMSAPAINAIKTSFGCKITVLCSSKAMEMADLIEEIDDKIVFDLPWLKFDAPEQNTKDLIEILRARFFDGCILFNVYSQNPAPCLMLAYLADIKLRAAYSRENLYGLLSHWLADDEPLFLIRHQVERDLTLARFLGARATTDRIRIREQGQAEQLTFLKQYKLHPKGYFLLHAGVSEKKRQYPKNYWMAIGRLMVEKYKMPVILTGNREERALIESIAIEIGTQAISLAGRLKMADLAVILKNACAVLSVNTGPMHLAAVLETPLVALYAQSNPQHHPYTGINRVLEYSVPQDLQSQNQIIRFVQDRLYKQTLPYPQPESVMIQLEEVLRESETVASPLSPVQNQAV